MAQELQGFLGEGGDFLDDGALFGGEGDFVLHPLPLQDIANAVASRAKIMQMSFKHQMH